MQSVRKEGQESWEEGAGSTHRGGCMVLLCFGSIFLQPVQDGNARSSGTDGNTKPLQQPHCTVAEVKNRNGMGKAQSLTRMCIDCL